VMCSYLLPFGFDAAMEAVQLGCKRWRFFPTISEITEAIEAEADDYVAPELAWGEVISAVRAGPNARPWSSRAVENAVRAVGGMRYLNSAPLAECPGPDRARFVDAYRESLRRARDEDRREVLPSRAAAQLLSTPTRKLVENT
jgi:hypothetical protein